MKLCYIADANSIHTYRWVEPFIDHGNEVYLISYRSVKSEWVGLAELIDLPKLFNVPKLRFAYWGWWIRHYVRQIQPDILHAHQLAGAGWLGVMAQYHPFIVSGWGSDILVEPYKSFLRHFLIKKVLQQCDVLTVPSQFMVEKLKLLGVSETLLRLIPWGVETDLFCPEPNDGPSTRKQLGIEPNTKVILSPRGVASIYNIDIILKSVFNIAPNFPEIRLVLLNYNSSEKYLSGLQQIIISHNLQNNVLWYPPQKMEDMARLYRMADVTISIPSSEGFGLTVYEAIASGCPTVISDLPVFEGELKNGVHTIKVPVRNVESTSQALLNLLGNEDLHFSIRQKGVDVCKTKSSVKRIEQTRTLYKTIIAGPQGR